MEDFKTLSEKQQLESDKTLFEDWKKGVFTATTREELEIEVSQVIAAFGRIRHTVNSLTDGYNEIMQAMTRNVRTMLNKKES